ncbi:MAG: OmpH family outer membrane protein [Nitrospiraceae bacterium]
MMGLKPDRTVVVRESLSIRMIGLMRVSLSISVLAMAGCTSAMSHSESRVGVVDPQRVLNETNAGKKARDSLAAFTKNRQALIELEEKELRRMEEDFVKQASVLSPTAKREREEQFRRKMTEYQQKAGELNREVQEKQKDVLEGFREKVEVVVEKVAKQVGVQVVVEKGKGGQTIYSDPALDISPRVIEQFNKDYP